ncbi:MAG: hypothetical protein PQJ58_00445 [Spirochaetales bacterium]|nr:hypothetical protein [Spirochaetales bacterium]
MVKISPEIQKEIQARQEKQLKKTLKLFSGSDRKALTGFLQSGQAPGSKEFKTLKPNVQKSVLKLNLISIEIMIKKVRNPFSRFRLKLAKLSYEKMMK